MPKKKTVRKKTASRKAASKKSVNKSAEIRRYLKSHPSASNSQIAAALSKRGISVTAGAVANVKSIDKRKKKAPKRKRRAAATAPVEDLKHANKLMLQAVELVVAAGAKEAKNLVATATDVVKRVGAKLER